MLVDVLVGVLVGVFVSLGVGSVHRMSVQSDGVEMSSSVSLGG